MEFLWKPLEMTSPNLNSIKEEERRTAYDKTAVSRHCRRIQYHRNTDHDFSIGTLKAFASTFLETDASHFSEGFHAKDSFDMFEKTEDENGNVFFKNSTISRDIVMGKNNTFYPNSVIGPSVIVGSNNSFHPFSVIGQNSQARNSRENGLLIIGDNNVFREYVSVHAGERTTRIGDNNLFMVGSHLGHDSIVANNVTLSNFAQIGGEVCIDSFASIGAFACIQQKKFIGAASFILPQLLIRSHVPPFALISEENLVSRQANIVGLRRLGFKLSDINKVENMLTGGPDLDQQEISVDAEEIFEKAIKNSELQTTHHEISRPSTPRVYPD